MTQQLIQKPANYKTWRWKMAEYGFAIPDHMKYVYRIIRIPNSNLLRYALVIDGGLYYSQFLSPDEYAIRSAIKDHACQVATINDKPVVYQVVG